MHTLFSPRTKYLESKQSTFNMRKYYQLMLAVVCFISVITLLFYRHEYYRLRYVLEVLNFFGKPGMDVAEPNLCLPLNATGQRKHKITYSDPLPVWQRISNSHYLYSAFWEVTDKDRRVRTLSFGVEDQVPDMEFGCYLWFDNIIDPVLAQFSFSKIIKDNLPKNTKITQRFVLYDLYCRPTLRNVEGHPYGVSFFKNNLINSVAFVPVHFIKPTFSNVTAICIPPSISQNLEKSTIAEFLSYHQVIGASQFIVYNSGRFSRVESALTDSAIQEVLGLGISVIPWNFPFSEASQFSRTIIEQDCLLRSRGKARNVVLLDWDEYIIPKYHSTLTAMVDDLGKSASLFKVMVTIFCTQLPDNLQSDPESILAVRKIHYVAEPERETHILQPSQISSRSQRILPGIAVVHRYAQCSEKQLSAAKENSDSVSMLRFVGDINKSKLLKSWRFGHILV